MSISLVTAFVWLIVANLLAMVPSRDNHWRRAYALIAVGVPLLGWVTYENGPLVGLLCLAAGASILRWPIRRVGNYFGRWVKRKTAGPSTGPAE